MFKLLTLNAPVLFNFAFPKQIDVLFLGRNLAETRRGDISSCCQLLLTVKGGPKTTIFIAIISYGLSHRRNLRVPPTFWRGGTVPPLFGRMTEKNNRDFPSSSAHVSSYNIQENVWRLGLLPQKPSKGSYRPHTSS